MHLGAADAAPGFKTLVDAIAAEFGETGVEVKKIAMDDWNADW